MERYRIVEGIGAYFVTFTIVEWMPVFIDETTCKIITESLNFSIQNKRLGVNAYVIMPITCTRLSLTRISTTNA